MEACNPAVYWNTIRKNCSTGPSVSEHLCISGKFIRKVIIHNPPHQLRSISHVCKCKESSHPHPTPSVAQHTCEQVQGKLSSTPHPISCVASHMCASARKVIIHTPPHQLRSIHVSKCKESYHPHPTPSVA